jgi:hypothetical protein
MTKITCKCVLCGAKRVYTEDDKIDELGPSCEKCMGPMTVEKVERRMRTSDRQAKTEAKP